MIHISDYISNDKKYYIYGTTTFGSYCYEKISDAFGSEKIIGFIETVPSLLSKNGKKVYSPREVCTSEGYGFIIASVTHRESMINSLVSAGVKSEQIVDMKDFEPYFRSLYGIRGFSVKNVCIWPPADNKNTMLFKKISWFIPDRVGVTVWSSGKISYPFNDNVRIISDMRTEEAFESSDMIMVWDADEIDSEILRGYKDKIYNIDPCFFQYCETFNYSKLYYYSHSHEERDGFIAQSKKCFEKCVSEIKKQGYSKSYIFCSGPSIDEIYGRDFTDGCGFICNSMVKDKELMKNISPKFLAITDVNFYFSPTEYCKQFFRDVYDVLNKYDTKLLVCDYEVPLLVRSYPELKNNVIGLPSDLSEFGIVCDRRLSERIISNILTYILLPVASTVSDDIYIAGCTGRDPDETYFWKHNGRTQYIELMDSVFEMYPSMFRDIKYDDYYDKHCATVRDLISYGESRGKRYFNITTSYIPALRERSIK